MSSSRIREYDNMPSRLEKLQQRNSNRREAQVVTNIHVPRMPEYNCPKVPKPYKGVVDKERAAEAGRRPSRRRGHQGGPGASSGEDGEEEGSRRSPGRS
jgi:hypothetical protein